MRMVLFSRVQIYKTFPAPALFYFQNIKFVISNFCYCIMKSQPSFDSARKSTGVVLIEFYASWCHHCQRMMPVVEQVKDLLGQQVPVYQYDIDKYPKAAQEANADSVPLFIIYDNGNEMWRHSGEISADQLLAACDAVLASYDPAGQ